MPWLCVFCYSSACFYRILSFTRQLQSVLGWKQLERLNWRRKGKAQLGRFVNQIKFENLVKFNRKQTPPFIPSTFHAGTQACMEEHELCTVEVTGLNPGNVLRKQVWRNWEAKWNYFGLLQVAETLVKNTGDRNKLLVHRWKIKTFSIVVPIRTL